MEKLYDLSSAEEKEAFVDNVIKRISYYEKAIVIKKNMQIIQRHIDEEKNKRDSLLNDYDRTIRKGKKAALNEAITVCEDEIDKASHLIESCEEDLKKKEFEIYGESGKIPIYFGTYPMKEDGSVEPIEWHVLSKNEEEVVLISRYILDQCCFNEENKETFWADSDIRKWLNSEFYEKAFSDTEKAMIIDSKITNPGNKGYNTVEGPDTIDKVFLLSYDEVDNFYFCDDERKTYPTPYAVSRGVVAVEDNGCGYYWLRSNGGNLKNASIVNFEGYIFEYGFYLNETRYGIRPVIVLNINN